MEIIPVGTTTIKQNEEYDIKHSEIITDEYLQIDTEKTRNFEKYWSNYSNSQSEIDQFQVELDKFPSEPLNETDEYNDEISTYTITRNESISSSVEYLEFDMYHHEDEENITYDINSNTMKTNECQQFGIDNKSNVESGHHKNDQLQN